jgi:hypothetical protein
VITNWVAPVSVGVACLVAAGILAVVGSSKGAGQPGKRSKRQYEWPLVLLLLLVTASDALMTTPIGSWIHEGVTVANTTAGAAVGRFTGELVGGIASIALAGVFVFRVVKRRYDNITYTTGMLAPAAFPAVPGVVGTVLMVLVTGPVWLVSQVIGFLFGWIG